MTLSVLVVGPVLVREGLGALLAQEEDFAVGTEAEAVFSERLPPDLIVCCADALDAVRAVQAHWPQANVLIVATGHAPMGGPERTRGGQSCDVRPRILTDVEDENGPSTAWRNSRSGLSMVN